MLVWPDNFNNTCLICHANLEFLLKKIKKMASKQKCTKREYYVEENADVLHEDVNFFLNKNQF